MSMFLCAICDQIKDSDDGGEEFKPGHPTDFSMICEECATERDN